jgi:membrane-bound lytic murein transglycosylase B
MWPPIFCLRVRTLQIRSPASGPFVYRLGHLVFNQARGVRLPYGLPLVPENSPCDASLMPMRLRQLACARANSVRRTSWWGPFVRLFAAILLFGMAGAAQAAPCSDTGGAYEAWKPQMAAEAAALGVGARGLSALMESSYSQSTITADRNQRSFRYSLTKFLDVRGADAIVSQGKRRLRDNAAFYASLEQAYGVPAGVIIAIHGMETGFGNFMGDTNVISAIATLSYDCRRSDFFTDHLIGALKLVDQGSITANSIGAKHGELGHTQFLPGNALRYGVDGNGDGVVDLSNQTDALASTANFLAQKGWRPGAGYQEGEPNFAVIESWNAATVYQQAIAIMGARIDG